MSTPMTDDELAYTAAGVPTWQHHLIHGEPMTQQQPGRHPFEQAIAPYVEHWTVSASCSQVCDLDFCFPDDSSHPYGAVRKLCAGCPVRPNCAKRAKDTRPRFGYWAGINAAAGRYEDNIAKWSAIAEQAVA